MCFSTQASFTAAALLAAAGYVNLRRMTFPAQGFLAVVPCFFALQQLAEGVLWLSFSHPDMALWLRESAIYLFLFIALVLWPAWIPLSLYVMERQPTRQILLLLTLLVGVGVSIVNLYFSIWQLPSVALVNQSFHYLGELPEEKLLYAAAVVLPCCISSLNKIWFFGVLLALMAIFAYFVYEVNYISVWCFFSALASLWIYKIFRDVSIAEAHLQ